MNIVKLPHFPESDKFQKCGGKGVSAQRTQLPVKEPSKARKPKTLGDSPAWDLRMQTRRLRQEDKVGGDLSYRWNFKVTQDCTRPFPMLCVCVCIYIGCFLWLL